MSPELRPPTGCLSDLSHRARVFTLVLDETSGALKVIAAALSACGAVTSWLRAFGEPWPDGEFMRAPTTMTRIGALGAPTEQYAES
jgi:hypothetical protein